MGRAGKNDVYKAWKPTSRFFPPGRSFENTRRLFDKFVINESAEGSEFCEDTLGDTPVKYSRRLGKYNTIPSSHRDDIYHRGGDRGESRERERERETRSMLRKLAAKT